MEKLMIGEISIRYRMVLNNLGNLTNSVLTNTIRIEFQDYFGKANKYLEELFRNHRRRTQGAPRSNCIDMRRPFNIETFKAVSIDFIQNHEHYKGRDFEAQIIHYDDTVERKHMIPFIKFHCNPIGIHILEKIWFRSI